ncbi:MAG TPA: cytochrome c oxidase subunit II [Rubrivivax sp.]|nr:cytochrome c oxidase subunit II [Rubrivivax sp.]
MLAAALCGAPLALLAGCAGPQSTLDAAGPAAAAIARMWWVMLAGSIVLFALVMALFAMSWWRPGWSRAMPLQRWVVLGGLALPAVVLVPLVAYALVTGERLLPLPGISPQRIEVHAERWGWTFRYPGHGGAMSQAVLHLPAGVPVDLVITSSDVIHSLWIPRLAGKLDAIPGRVNVLRLHADTPGTYSGQCAEFCGVGHTTMRFEVIVHPAAEFVPALAALGTTAGPKP